MSLKVSVRSCGVLSFEKKGKKTPWFYNSLPICFPESLAPSRKRGAGKTSVEDRCNFEKIWVNKKSMSWAWFRKPYLHQNPLDQANSVYQRHYTTALVVIPAITCHARKVVLGSGCVLRKKEENPWHSTKWRATR